MRRAGGAPLRVAALQGAAALWLSWLHTDEVHPIWPTLHTMVWTDVAFRTLTAFMSNEENALNNPLIEEALVKGHLATQVLAIRRLVEDSSKDRISLRAPQGSEASPQSFHARELRLLRRHAVRLSGLAESPFRGERRDPGKGGAPRRASGRHPRGGTAHSVRQAHRHRRPDKAKPRRLPLRICPVYSNLSAAFAHAGKMDEAKAALAEARRLNPAITIKWMKEHTPNLPAVFDGIRNAGLPEE
jgi:hypothetical protein